jgi:hypothetical protein
MFANLDKVNLVDVQANISIISLLPMINLFATSRYKCHLSIIKIIDVHFLLTSINMCIFQHLMKSHTFLKPNTTDF